jgi:hypothetical protein
VVADGAVLWDKRKQDDEFPNDIDIVNRLAR